MICQTQDCGYYVLSLILKSIMEGMLLLFLYPHMDNYSDAKHVQCTYMQVNIVLRQP